MKKKFLFKLILFIFPFFLFCCGINKIEFLDNETSPLVSAIQLYRGPLNHLSSVRNSECPMFPSCSAYSVASVKKHGAVVGTIMTFDRLIRCGRDEIAQVPIIMDYLKYFDPVERNDFWWDH
ncbi:MAG: membrane protein insertion efficiency factor YidD [Desulfobacterales bacterium]|nr:membrane protein insertion efficiency factor YidD [Desulfobacterales bacterium]